KAAKFDGLRDAIRDRIEHEAVVVAAHFPASLREARTHLEAAGVSVQLVEGRDARRQLFESAGHGAVVAALVETLANLAPPDAPASVPLPLTILVSERHPLRSKDDALTPFAEQLTPPGRIGFHLSLEDPVLRPF